MPGPAHYLKVFKGRHSRISSMHDVLESTKFVNEANKLKSEVPAPTDYHPNHRFIEMQKYVNIPVSVERGPA